MILNAILILNDELLTLPSPLGAKVLLHPWWQHSEQVEFLLGRHSRAVNAGGRVAVSKFLE